jgi:hypothetical protein
MINIFSFIYRLILFIVRPFFIVPEGTAYAMGNTDQPMDAPQPQATNTQVPLAGLGMPSVPSTDALQARLTQLEEELRAQRHHQVSMSTSSEPKEPKINFPSAFKGDKSQSEEFILKCDQVFNVCRRTYHDNTTRLAFVFNLLEGSAYQWLKPALLALDKPDYVTSWPAFRAEFLKTYADSDVKETARYKLKTLKQTTSASNFATDFKRYALYLEWSDETLRQTFFDGLRSDVQDRLLSPQRFFSFSELVDSAIEWDNLLFNRRRSAKSTSYVETMKRPSSSVSRSSAPVTTSTPDSAFGPWPMDVDSIQHKGPLTQEEKDRRRQNNLCLYCGKAGHQVKDCRAKSSSTSVSTIEEQGNEEPQQ